MSNEVPFWYAEEQLKDEEPGSPWIDLCRVMQELEANDTNDDEEGRAMWKAFAYFVSGDALDQEVYGEYLRAQPEVLGPMWLAYRAGHDDADGAAAPGIAVVSPAGDLNGEPGER